MFDLQFNTGDRIVSNRQPDHNHGGNGETALARKAVGDMKHAVVNDITVTTISSQLSVTAGLDGGVLTALPKR